VAIGITCRTLLLEKSTALWERIAAFGHPQQLRIWWWLIGKEKMGRSLPPKFCYSNCMKFNTEVCHKCFLDDGIHYEIGPDSDVGGWIEIRVYDDKHVLEKSMVFPPEISEWLAASIQKVRSDIEVPTKYD
jgi:hypothetical protein